MEEMATFFGSILGLGLTVGWLYYLYKKTFLPLFDKLDRIIELLSDRKEPPTWLK